MFRLRRLIALLAAAASLVLSAAPAPAVELVYTSGPGSYAVGWTAPVIVVPQNAQLTYVNLDVAYHDVVADKVYGSDTQPWCDGLPAGKCPLFWSQLIGLSKTTPVLGLDATTPGRIYPFVCSIHRNMTGTLVVLPPLPA